MENRVRAVVSELDDSKDIPVQYFQKKLNQKEDRNEVLNIDLLKREEIDYIEELSDELNRVVDFHNVDSDNRAQKEELLQKVLQLGGENYTFSDLRRDLSSFDEEHKSSTISPLAQCEREGDMLEDQ